MNDQMNDIATNALSDEGLQEAAGGTVYRERQGTKECANCKRRYLAYEVQCPYCGCRQFSGYYNANNRYIP